MGKKRTKLPKKGADKIVITIEDQLKMLRNISRQKQGLPPRTQTHKDKKREGGRRSRQDKFQDYDRD